MECSSLAHVWGANSGRDENFETLVQKCVSALPVSLVHVDLKKNNGYPYRLGVPLLYVLFENYGDHCVFRVGSKLHYPPLLFSWLYYRSNNLGAKQGYRSVVSFSVSVIHILKIHFEFNFDKTVLIRIK